MVAPLYNAVFYHTCQGIKPMHVCVIGFAHIQTGCCGEGPHPINTLENEQGRCHMAAMENYVHLILNP